MKNKILILTKPPIAVSYRQLFYKFLRQPRHTLHLIKNQKKISGHPAVTLSLIRGLRKGGHKFVYNPLLSIEIKDCVVVLSGIDTLRYCVDMKKNNKIRKLFAGPNIVVHADDYDCVIGSKEIDKILVPSSWVKKAYENECGNTKGRILVWPSGTDENFWKPSIKSHQTNKLVIVYKKAKDYDLPANLYSNINKEITKNNYEVCELHYGKYNKKYYKKILEKSIAMVYITKTESQGLAIQEAWSMGVPVLVWKSGTKRIDGRLYRETSTAPYLSSSTGSFWANIKELNLLLNTLSNKQYNPRKWVVQNATDLKSANLLVESFGKFNQ